MQWWLPVYIIHIWQRTAGFEKRFRVFGVFECFAACLSSIISLFMWNEIYGLHNIYIVVNWFLFLRIEGAVNSERERERDCLDLVNEWKSERKRETNVFGTFLDMKVINEENKINDITPQAFINKYFRPDSCSFLAVMCSRYIEPIVIGIDKFTVWGRQQVWYEIVNGGWREGTRVIAFIQVQLSLWHVYYCVW